MFKHTACGVKCFVDGDVIATLCKISCAGKTGRTGADNCYSVSVALGSYGFFLAKSIVPVGNKSFKTTDADRLALDSTHALGSSIG